MKFDVPDIWVGVIIGLVAEFAVIVALGLLLH